MIYGYTDIVSIGLASFQADLKVAIEQSGQTGPIEKIQTTFEFVERWIRYRFSLVFYWDGEQLFEIDQGTNERRSIEDLENKITQFLWTEQKSRYFNDFRPDSDIPFREILRNFEG